MGPPSMPKRNDIRKVLVIGSGPIVIGQACEFDYSGTQAIKALREEGVEVVLLNSNPATVMTDPEFAHRTYIEPITVEVAERILAQARESARRPLSESSVRSSTIEAEQTGAAKKTVDEQPAPQKDSFWSRLMGKRW